MNDFIQTAKANILVVDDTLDNLRLLMGMLSKQGYVVRPAPNGSLALTAAQSDPPDLILLDIKMPEKDGYQVCQELKADRRTSDIPVIFLSALDEVFDKVKAFAVGGVDYITKPFQFEEVLARIENQLTIRNLQRQLKAQNTQLQQELEERAAIEEALRLSETKYRELVETSNCIILRWDASGYIRFLNDYGHSFFGYEDEEILARNVVGTIVPETETSGRDLRFLMEDICRNPEAYLLNENENICRDGKRVWVCWSNKPIFDRAGKLVEILSVGTDATARKQVEEALRAEQKKSERLLLNILPEAIADQLKQNQGVHAERFDEATVLFADLVGFTPLAAHVSPLELVGLLNEIFSEFDQLAYKYGLEKIKTIGDAYMVAGGLPLQRPDHAEAIAEMALDMQASIARFQITPDEPFQIRIGIHTGPVVAGVIGVTKFSYDLWGDTVNTAARMESHGLAGAIQVTEQTYERLRDRYLFQLRGVIPVKGKGNMRTYLLLDRKNN